MSSVAAPDPNTGKERSYTIDEFLKMDFEEPVELVNGRIIPMGYTSWKHGDLLLRTSDWLRPLVDPAIALLIGGEAGIVTTGGTIRKLDVAYVTRDRLSQQPEDKAALIIAPELIVEILSPGNAWEDIMAKVDEYLAMGVEEVWLVSPTLRKLFRHRAGQPTVEFAERAKVPADVLSSGAELVLSDLFGKS